MRDAYSSQSETTLNKFKNNLFWGSLKEKAIAQNFMKARYFNPMDPLANLSDRFEHYVHLIIPKILRT
jgi:hypothetical protein